MAEKIVTVVVVGGGLVGLVGALAISDALKTSGGEVILIAPSPTRADRRTTAMLMPSVNLLRRLGAWGDLADASAALRVMRIVDASGRLVTAPPVEFRSAEIDEEVFGYNVPNDQAAELLCGTLEGQSNVTTVDARAISLDTIPGSLALDNGKTVEADLFVAADGQDSLLRAEAGITARQWSYPQTAVVTTFAHTLPHGGVSTELHTRTGPFTQVPLPSRNDAKNRSSLVWVVPPGDAEGLMQKGRDWLAWEIENRLQSSLGKVTVESGLQQFALSGMTARQFAADGVVLVGEAAHVMPPIGAQGFNLGVSDIETLTQLLSREVPVDQIYAQYDRKRRAEVLIKTSGIDLLNRSLLSGFLPLHLGRSIALGALSENSSLRKLLMSGVMRGPASLLSREKDRLEAFRS